MTDDELLARFAKNAPAFQAFLPELTAEERHSFCEIARLVHDEGLDWYFTDIKNEYFRFGRKNNGNDTAVRKGTLAACRVGHFAADNAKADLAYAA
ncbi:hypothetical protein LDL36_14285 [Komagataeibacter sp. FNDCR1]|nr:hypothetical protein [Komagataeibacter sp. FNDCR1]